MTAVAGALECVGVLEVLSEYLDGELDGARRAAVEAHLAVCERCERFGREFGAVVKALRQKLGAAADAPVEAVRRLAHALKGPGDSS